MSERDDWIADAATHFDITLTELVRESDLIVEENAEEFGSEAAFQTYETRRREIEREDAKQQDQGDEPKVRRGGNEETLRRYLDLWADAPKDEYDAAREALDVLIRALLYYANHGDDLSHWTEDWGSVARNALTHAPEASQPEALPTPDAGVGGGGTPHG